MRFSIHLCLPKSFKWQHTQAWKNKKYIWDPPLYVPKIWQDKDIIDAAKLYLKPVVKYPSWSSPVPDPSIMSDPNVEDHPDYNNTPVYDFTPDTNLLEGINQALILTKTQLMDGVPNIIEKHKGILAIADEDELMKKFIMQANVWNPTKDKLPKRFNPQLPRWKMRGEYGIPYEKRALILLQNILRLMSMNASKYSDFISARYLNKNHAFSTFYHYNGEKHIQISGTFNYLLNSNQSLSMFSSMNEIEESKNHILPDLYPISPLIDLNKSHFWSTNHDTGIPEDAIHNHPHTAFIIDPANWPDDVNHNPHPIERNITRAIMLTFALTHAYAKQMLGSYSLNLPVPICMQCIHTDGVLFNFIYFQLNTLDFSENSNVKNMVWIDSGNALYVREEPKRAMLRNTVYSNYDPKVLHKMYASFSNGLNTT